MSELDDVLSHYGVKGMKWGVRNSEGAPSKPAPSEDAVLAKQYKTTAKKGGSQALSNKELQDLVTRMNLEKQYATLNPTKSKVAKKFVADTLLQVGKQQLTKVAQDQAARQIAKMLAGR